VNDRCPVKSVDDRRLAPYPGSVVEREEGAAMREICFTPFRLDVVPR
jgi:hypothetical protein